MNLGTYFHLCLVLGAGLALFAWFRQMELRNRPEIAVGVIWGLLIVDASLHPGLAVPAGIFHPEIAGVSFRTVDLVIPVALAARLSAVGLPSRFSGAGMLWTAFLAWIVASAALGLATGNRAGIISFEAKAVIYLGAMVLAATVPPERYVHRPGFLRLIWVTAAVAMLLILTDSLGIRIALDMPGVPLEETGRLGSDAATLFASVGILALAIGAFRDSHRLRYLLPAVPLIASTLTADQRAALLGLGAALLTLALLLAVSKRRLRITPTEAGLATAAAIACLLAPAVTNTALGSSKIQLPFQEELEQTFTRRQKQLSADVRVNQWNEAKKMIADRPVFGWGLGKEYYFYEPGFREFQKTDLTHNIFLDLLVRTGAVGLLLFLAALAASLAGSLRAWLGERDDLAAALALGSVALVVGLVAKGQVESIFEKYRLAVLLGLGLGMVASSAAALRGEPYRSGGRALGEPSRSAAATMAPATPAPVGQRPDTARG